MIAPFEALAAVPEELSPQSMPRRSCAPASRPSTRCATAVPAPGIWSPCSASAGWATSACSSPRRWAFAPWPSRAARTRGHSRSSSARTSTSTARVQDVAAELTRLGGAKVILATVTDAKSMSAAVGGLGTDGRLVVLGASPEAIEVSPFALILGRRGDRRLALGHRHRFGRHAAFSVQADVRPMIETPAGAAAEAYAAHDERQGALPRRAHALTARGRAPVAWLQRTSQKQYAYRRFGYAEAASSAPGASPGPGVAPGCASAACSGSARRMRPMDSLLRFMARTVRPGELQLDELGRVVGELGAPRGRLHRVVEGAELVDEPDTPRVQFRPTRAPARCC